MSLEKLIHGLNSIGMVLEEQLMYFLGFFTLGSEYGITRQGGHVHGILLVSFYMGKV